MTPTMYVKVPTYDPVEGQRDFDYDRMRPVAVREADGLQVILGDPKDDDAPHIVFERQADHWCIFLHPDNGDPACHVEIFDDKRVAVSNARGDIVAMTN